MLRWNNQIKLHISPIQCGYSSRNSPEQLNLGIFAPFFKKEMMEKIIQACILIRKTDSYMLKLIKL